MELRADRCQAIIKGRGSAPDHQCGNRPKDGGMYCGIHMKKSLQAPSMEQEVDTQTSAPQTLEDIIAQQRVKEQAKQASLKVRKQKQEEEAKQKRIDEINKRLSAIEREERRGLQQPVEEEDEEELASRFLMGRQSLQDVMRQQRLQSIKSASEATAEKQKLLKELEYLKYVQPKVIPTDRLSSEGFAKRLQASQAYQKSKEYRYKPY